ncbi:MAG: PhzF family phenazine biosynthesis protein [Anaerolineae bacterium]|nr:PhzF family phenazine biosynthesis protein [Anaerolineae bacterium]
MLAPALRQAPSGQTRAFSRFFAPAAGIPEDAVIGPTHRTLALYWAERLGRERPTARPSRRGAASCTATCRASGFTSVRGRSPVPDD